MELCKALRDDLNELGTCVVVCTLHTLGVYVLFRLLGVEYSAAVTTAVLVGAVKLFQVTNDRDYMHRTADVLRKKKKASAPVRS